MQRDRRGLCPFSLFSFYVSSAKSNTNRIGLLRFEVLDVFDAVGGMCGSSESWGVVSMVWCAGGGSRGGSCERREDRWIDGPPVVCVSVSRMRNCSRVAASEHPRRGGKDVPRTLTPCSEVMTRGTAPVDPCPLDFESRGWT